MGSASNLSVEKSVDFIMHQAFILPSSCVELEGWRRQAVRQALHNAFEGLQIGVPEGKIIERHMADARRRLELLESIPSIQAETLLAEASRTIGLACQLVRVNLSERVTVAIS